MSTTENYVRQAQTAWSEVADGWYQPTKALLQSVPTSGYGFLNPTQAFAQASRLGQRLAEVNLEYAQDLAGAVRKHLTGLASVLKDEIATTAQWRSSRKQPPTKPTRLSGPNGLRSGTPGRLLVRPRRSGIRK
jgi:hypothetical protein